MTARQALVEYVSDNAHRPMAVLGAVVSFLKSQPSESYQRIADAVDLAISAELDKQRREIGVKRAQSGAA